jgi:TctA family transporter
MLDASVHRCFLFDFDTGGNHDDVQTRIPQVQRLSGCWFCAARLNPAAGQALATGAMGSFVAGTIGTIALTFFAPMVVDAALAFGPAEYFSLMILSLVAVSAMLGNSMIRGLLALSLGALFGLVGINLQTGQARFTFGQAGVHIASIA